METTKGVAKLEANRPIIQPRNAGGLNLGSGCVDDSRYIEEENWQTMMMIYEGGGMTPRVLTCSIRDLIWHLLSWRIQELQ